MASCLGLYIDNNIIKYAKAIESFTQIFCQFPRQTISPILAKEMVTTIDRPLSWVLS